MHMLRKIVAVWILTQVLAVWGLGCADGSHPATRSPEAAPVRAAREAATPPTAEPWDGVYASPSEIGGFSGTVLALDSTAGFLRDRMRFYTDVRDADAIDEPVKSGSPLVEGDHLYVPEASGYTREGKISLL
ncbi:MAG TPA: hypothetical protein VLJ39_18135, partial [Tepidisphaeraceae bacterium]|nr:hypothetical protein [Tepidisphaeraceae bacterium]